MEKQPVQTKRQYGLITAITMIVGIVIGSGIFFKSDDILSYTGGNVGLGVLVFCVAALSIIFGSLTISRLAALTDRPGGAITYAEEFIDKRFGAAFGWFQTFVYYPTLTVVISWVVGIYTCLLFGLEMTLPLQIAIGFAWFALCFAFNIASAKLGGWFQNLSTFIKLIPLLLIGVLGFLLGKPGQAFSSPSTLSSAGWISAIAPIAFSFDGWIISTAISHEVKDATRNLPRALVFAPLFVLAAYLLYFVGVSAYVTPQKVLELGDGSVSHFAEQLIGGFGAKAIMVFVVISVMGTVNGVVLGFIRLPYSLALRGMLPGSRWLSKVDARNNMPIRSGLFAVAICLVWWGIHWLVMDRKLLGNSDISEIGIVVTYVLYAVLYYQVFRLWRAGKIHGVGKGLVFPLLATLGSAFILYGGLRIPSAPFFAAVYVAILAIGFFYGAKGRSLKN